MSNLDEKEVAAVLAMPAAKQRALCRALKTSESKANRRIGKALEARLTKDALRLGCSMPRIEAAKYRGVPFKDPGMKRGRGLVRVGDAERTKPSRRWTPPQTVETEDRYDLMTDLQAILCNDPPSITGLQMHEVRMRRRGVEPSKTILKKRK